MKKIPSCIVTLITDFGFADEFSGVMKGVILSINPEAHIVDISHGIEPHDVFGASLLLKTSYPFFPKGSIHIAVVDPGVGGERRILALSACGHLFLAPDNGILTPVFETEKIETSVWVSNRSYFLSPVSHTFHGRDILAPVAAYLSLGTPLTDLGPPADARSWVRSEVPKPSLKNNCELIGSIIWIDRFGNLMTNIHETEITRMKNLHSDSLPMVMIKSKKIGPLYPSYNSVKKGEPVAVIGSKGYLEAAVFCGNASQYFKAKRGDSVRVIFKS